MLQATLDTTLVEASPHKCTWGIGLREDNPRRHRRETWLGQNKLGQILTELRDEVFLEFQTLTTINFTLAPTHEKESAQVQEQEHIVDQIRPEYETKLAKKRYTFLNGVKAIYHQHYLKHFTVAGITNNCVEQYRQHGKAQLFEDDLSKADILKATEPEEQRRIGLEVKHFDKNIWAYQTNELMQEANFYKFTQNEELKQELLTMRGTIAQACPFRSDWCT